MKRVLLASILLTGLSWVASVYFKPPETSLDLRELFSRASLGPIMAPSQPLGSFASGPFAGMGWDSVRPTEFRKTLEVNPRGSHLRFCLSHRLPLEVTLEGRLSDDAGGPLNAEVWLNGASWRTLKLEPQLRRFTLQAEVDDVVEGLNDIHLKVEPTTQWTHMSVIARDGGRVFSGAALESYLSGEELRLPYGHSVSYPVTLEARSQLVLEDMRLWQEAGAAAVPEGDGQLLVRVHSGEPPWDRSYSLGREQRRLHLQVPTRCAAELTLMATMKAKPAPGQAGLILQRPRVDTWVPEAPQVSSSAPPTTSTTAPRPNVVIYLIDTLRADHLGCYGYTAPTSPNIDGFRKDAVLFAQCTAQSGWTKASTASILCSMLPRVHGAMDFGDKLHPGSVLVSEVLRQAGYETRAVVTNPFVSQTFGFERGFEKFEFLKEATSGEVNRAILPWLSARAKDKPFFLYVHTIDPHLPYSPPEDGPRGLVQSFRDADLLELEKSSTRLDYWGRDHNVAEVQGPLTRAIQAYDGEIAANDVSFGALMGALRQQGLYDNTIVVVVSDHGEEFLDHGRMGHNNSLFQELLHVPLIIKFPQSRGAGTRIEPCWQHIDIVPTILACLQIQPPPTMVGRPYIPGGSNGDVDRPAFISIKTGIDAPRWGQGKLPWLLDMDVVRLGSWVLSRTWACHDSRHQPQQLFNLAADPGEGRNQAYQRPEVTVRLNALLRQHFIQERRTQGQPRPSQAPAEDVQRFMRSLQYLR